MVARESVGLLVQHFRHFSKPFDAPVMMENRGPNAVLDPSVYGQCMQDVQDGVVPNFKEGMKKHNLDKWRTHIIMKEAQNCLRYIFAGCVDCFYCLLSLVQ